VFLGVMASPAEHPHFLYHAGLDAKAGHYRACEPSPESADSQAPALHAGVRDFLFVIMNTSFDAHIYRGLTCPFWDRCCV